MEVEKEGSRLSQKQEDDQQKDVIATMQDMLANKEKEISHLMSRLEGKQKEIVEQQDLHFEALLEKDTQISSLSQEIQNLKQDYVDIKRKSTKEEPGLKGNLKKRVYPEQSEESILKSP